MHKCSNCGCMMRKKSYSEYDFFQCRCGEQIIDIRQLHDHSIQLE